MMRDSDTVCAMLLMLGLILLSGPCLTQPEQRPAPPEQASAGPGGRHYPHASYDRTHHGSGDTEYWLFVPAEPTPRSAPVVVFIHGWMAIEPLFYEAWIAHLARRGNAVIYPRYQANARTRAIYFTTNAAQAVREGLLRLRKEIGVQPEEGKLAVVGHSAGGAISANMAATWQDLGIPKPAAVMCVEPGRAPNAQARWGIPMAEMSAIAAETLMLCLVGAEDTLAGSALATETIEGASAVPWSNKNLVTAVTDDHGEPALVADHTFPAGQLRSARQVNALDYYACWKLFDGLTDAAFYGRNREYALGDTPQQRFMGLWSDGVPVKELQVRAQ